ncbi:retropepsin-like aspartic protease [Epilithonimonas ginsengisoli]|uniref:Retropepsin-like aspartic protease n=1 Tax=Epilithonimonas ginsengisoli TaxID=1245592 RepID=A0ABU4JDZ2_9FLAO|nr:MULTISPECIES: retropepsin-like aspartic protease [Chryseobacterium group]MBV6879036.1 retroviral-like aspartic protease family protein [Epilithonimonas sp. FP105]MDW8547883.1 retropepsin-like aspartic protease [Epilithonimonas ginsengisoli]OAH74944.1 hypothetical protein AXA65_05625 [Chryseobacterium sp. FP211-J200]
MKIVPSLILIFLVGCKHPESNEFNRDNKSNSPIESENILQNNSLTTISDSAIFNNVEEIPSEEPTNILAMENEDGVKYVWIEINGIRLRFIFDTGASSICISPAEATVLYRQGTLSREDILDKEYFQDATGKISEGTKVNLKTVKIGNRILQNIKATVVDNVDAPLLLGQTVLENFGKIEIDNKNGEIIFR